MRDGVGRSVGTPMASSHTWYLTPACTWAKSSSHRSQPRGTTNVYMASPTGPSHSPAANSFHPQPAGSKLVASLLQTAGKRLWVYMGAACGAVPAAQHPACLAGLPHDARRAGKGLPLFVLDPLNHLTLAGRQLHHGHAPLSGCKTKSSGGWRGRGCRQWAQGVGGSHGARKQGQWGWRQRRGSSTLLHTISFLPALLEGTSPLTARPPSQAPPVCKGVG